MEGVYSEKVEPLETHQCSLEEMGLVESDEPSMFEFEFWGEELEAWKKHMIAL